jgi:amidase
VGIRSTLGLTSRAGIIPLSFDRDVGGPIGRTVEDVAKVFNVIVGYDPADPYTEHGRGHQEEDYTAFLATDGLRGAHIGVLRALADDSTADTAVVRLFGQAISDLRRLGARVDTFDFDVSRELERPEMFCPRFRYDMGRYLASLGAEAPIHDVAEVLETGQYSPYVERSLRSEMREPLDVPPAQWKTPCPDYFENPERQAYLHDLVAAMDSAHVDALIYPTWLNPPAHIDRARQEYKGDNSQLVAPATGMPAITVPMGFTYGHLPAGLQILGRPYAEGLLFRYAYAYEQGTDHRRPPPGFPELGR